MLFKKEFLLYRLKLLIKFFVECLIKLYSFKKIFYVNLLQNNSNKKAWENSSKFYENENFNLFVFKSGTMGDHLIIISVIQYLRINGFNINAYIVCRRKSIFPSIKNFGNRNNIRFIEYSNFLRNF